MNKNNFVMIVFIFLNKQRIYIHPNEPWYLSILQATYMARMSGRRGNKCLQEAISWGFHPYQEIIETKVQILDLVHLLAPLELPD